MPFPTDFISDGGDPGFFAVIAELPAPRSTIRSSPLESARVRSRPLSVGSTRQIVYGKYPRIAS